MTDCVVDEELTDGAAEGQNDCVCHEFRVSEDESETGHEVASLEERACGEQPENRVGENGLEMFWKYKVINLFRKKYLSDMGIFKILINPVLKVFTPNIISKLLILYSLNKAPCQLLVKLSKIMYPIIKNKPAYSAFKNFVRQPKFGNFWHFQNHFRPKNKNFKKGFFTIHF